MIVKFSTKAGALVMHGDVAVAMLKALGHSGTVPGAILAADLPAALASLQRALDAGGLEAAAPPEPWDEDDQRDDEREAAPRVSMRMRAVPLLDMIQTAIARGSDLMWEQG
ncbi:MAG: DUF1840 family protein [Lysobacterales bacterium]|nr:MAG: DUF1840 family protein [Xanthomonadales bacterium]